MRDQNCYCLAFVGDDDALQEKERPQLAASSAYGVKSAGVVIRDRREQL